MLYHSLEEAQGEVDLWMVSYDSERTQSGKYSYGKTPLQAFFDSARLA